MRTRFAPSPTGYLHLGHAFAAFSVWDAAEKFGGEVLLRIEDIDANRCRPDFETALLEDLAWLGLSWPAPVLRQSQETPVYAAALERLIALGVMVRCFKTRQQITQEALHAPHGAMPLFRVLEDAQEQEKTAAGLAFAWRISMPRVGALLGARVNDLHFTANGREARVDLAQLSDVVLARKDAPASYHLCSVVDDARQGVTDIIRGEDLADAAPLHVTLQALLGLPTPNYHHHKLILAADGKRLSKRDGATALRAWRANGATPQDIRAAVGMVRQ